MKFMNKTLLVVFAVCGVTSAAFGYDFTFKNKTNKPVAVKLNLAASTADFDDTAVVAPNGTHKFSFTGFKSGFCLSKISYGSVDEGSSLATGPSAPATPTASAPAPAEPSKNITVAATQFTLNVCQSLAFDITQYGENITVSLASE